MKRHPSVRVAFTQTKNAYAEMPLRIDEVDTLVNKFGAMREANLNFHLKLIRWAHTRGVEIICLGELFAFPYFALTCHDLWFSSAEDAYKGPSVNTLKIISRKLSMTIIAPIFEKFHSSFYDSAVVIEKGDVKGVYRKTHIPQGTNDQGSFVEKYYFSAGDVKPYFPVFHLSQATIGVMICFDRHFPDVSRILAQEGAQIIFCPNVTFGSVSERIWRQEGPVIAAWNGVFVGMGNRLGKERPWNIRYFGKSFFSDPSGQILPNLSERNDLIVADVDLSLVSQNSHGWDLRENRRPDIYQ